MTHTEKLEIAAYLQQYDYFFRIFWDLGTPVFTEKVSTAAITFDKDGTGIQMSFNPDFWAALNIESKCFVVCHEILHVLLNHGKRFVQYLGTDKFSKVNQAADVVINESLVQSFGFVKPNLNIEEVIGENICWLSTVFKDDPTVLPEETTDYYLLKLLENPNNGGGGGSKLVDEHIVIQDSNDGESSGQQIQGGIPQDIIDQLGEFLTEELGDKLPKEFSDNNNAGKGEGNWSTVTKKRLKVKKPWESVIRNWTRKYYKEDFCDVVRWERTAPKYHNIFSKGNRIPSELKLFGVCPEKRRINVFFFLDTSGSCYHLAERFFNAARTLDPRRFNLKLFCFDTRTYKLDIKTNNVYGGGGTYFHIIESAIQQEMKDSEIPYPDAVWILSDGYGNTVHPQFPNRWYWFLTAGGSTAYISPKSKVFDLDKFI